ncbi:MAG: chorismate mutase [Candidatus Absconditabacteria bacterium]
MNETSKLTLDNYRSKIDSVDKKILNYISQKVKLYEAHGVISGNNYHNYINFKYIPQGLIPIFLYTFDNHFSVNQKKKKHSSQIIDQNENLNLRLLNQLDKRFHLIHQIGKYKKQIKMGGLQIDRWNQVLLSKKDMGAKLEIPTLLVGILWNLIHEYALLIEDKIINEN